MSAGPAPSTAVYTALAVTIVAAATGLAVFGSWPPLAGYLVGINLATLTLYGVDKRAAVKGRLRVPEKLLHACAFAGGSPAALLGQRIFRHKTAKLSFQIWFWLIVAAQVGAVVAVLYWRNHPPAWLPGAGR
jgi:uncharacterized membrane protein YsdA (DUF1294 family)